MAARVVLYYRSEGPQTKAAALIPPGTSTTVDVVDQPRAQLGAVKGRAPTAGRIRDLQTREVDMVVVMQVMLIRRLLPCKRRPLRLWEFNPEGPQILQHFMGMTPMEMYKLFFGSQEACPELTEHAGLSCNRPDTQVSSSESGHTVCLPFDDSPHDQFPSKQEWIAQAKLIWCPAPLPETAPDSVLVRMLEVAPPEEGEGESGKATASPEEALERGGIENPSLQGEKRIASEDPGAKAPKRGKKSSPEGPASGEAPGAQSPLKISPPTSHK